MIKQEQQLENFWAKVEKTDTCWLWKASVSVWGYGQCSFDGKTKRAHRVSYELAKGPIPKGLQIDHTCRVRNCVNPDHLEAVTARENVLRGISPAAVNATKTKCLRGHSLVGEKARVVINHPVKGSYRACRECFAIHERRRKLLNKVASNKKVYYDQGYREGLEAGKALHLKDIEKIREKLEIILNSANKVEELFTYRGFLDLKDELESVLLTITDKK